MPSFSQERIVELKLLAQLSDIIYNDTLKEQDFSFLPDSWKVMHLSENTECGGYEYKALAILNESNKEIIIANCGTRPNPIYPTKFFHDLWADLQLYFKHVPSKFNSATGFIEQIKNLLGETYTDYKLTLTGHSLGGFLSALGSVKAKALGFTEVRSINFDPPGAKEVAEKYAEQIGYEGDITENIENYVACPNLVNLTNTQLGKSYYAPKLEQVEPHKTTWFEYLSRPITELIKQIDDHMIWNISSFFAWQETLQRKTVDLGEIVGKIGSKSLTLKSMPELAELYKLEENSEYFAYEPANNGTKPLYKLADSDLPCDHNDLINYYSGNFDEAIPPVEMEDFHRIIELL